MTLIRRLSRIAGLSLLLISIGSVSAADILIDALNIESNRRTRDATIESELDLNLPLRLSPAGLVRFLTDRRQRLENLDLFSSIRLEIVPSRLDSAEMGNAVLSNSVTLRAACRDKWTLFPVPLFMYGTRYGYLASLELMDFNFLGLAHRIDIQAAAGTLKKSFDFVYEAPRLKGGRFFLNTGFSWFSGKDFGYGGTGARIYETRLERTWISLEAGRRWQGNGRDLETGFKTIFLKERNRVVLNTSGREVVNGFDSSLSAVLREGRINYDGPVRNGHLIALESSWLIDRPGFEVLASSIDHRRFGARNYASWRIAGVVSPQREISFNPTDYIRGVSQGGIRANYAVYANAEAKFRLFKIRILTPVEFFLSFFADAGNGTRAAEKFSLSETVVSAGPGLRIFPTEVGGGGMGVRLDAGANLAGPGTGKSFTDRLFLVFALSEMF